MNAVTQLVYNEDAQCHQCSVIKWLNVHYKNSTNNDFL
jgi:hypothetical protein